MAVLPQLVACGCTELRSRQTPIGTYLKVRGWAATTNDTRCAHRGRCQGYTPRERETKIRTFVLFDQF